MRPHAISWPPPDINKPVSFNFFISLPRSIPFIDLPDPFPIPFSSIPITITGLLNLSLRRPATMPITPGCQPSIPTTITELDLFKLMAFSSASSKILS